MSTLGRMRHAGSLIFDPLGMASRQQQPHCGTPPALHKMRSALGFVKEGEETGSIADLAVALRKK
jgi:hypothetical protein